MAMCERFEVCAFYDGKITPDKGLGAMYVRKYCAGDSSQCARQMIAKELGPDKVPVQIYPNMHEVAKDLIEKYKNK